MLPGFHFSPDRHVYRDWQQVSSPVQYSSLHVQARLSAFSRQCHRVPHNEAAELLCFVPCFLQTEPEPDPDFADAKPAKKPRKKPAKEPKEPKERTKKVQRRISPDGAE